MSYASTLTYSVDGLSFTVQFDRYDALQHDRCRWNWQIRETILEAGIPCPSGETLARGDDLTTVGDPVEAEAMETLASFLGAWLEGVAHEERTGGTFENSDLFPRTLLGRVDVDTWVGVVEQMRAAVTVGERG